MLLSAKPSSSAALRPAAARRTPVRMLPLVVARAGPKKEDIERVQQVLEKTLKEAEEACDQGGTKDECAVAMDAVEEVSAALAHKKAAKSSDPLEAFCDDNPDADECRVYDD